MLANFMAFQAAWFTCVLGAAAGWPFLGTAAALGAAGWHLSRCHTPKREAVLLSIVMLIGTVFLAGWTAFASGAWLPGIVPHWMIGLWLAFATTLNASLSWLSNSPSMAALGGAIAGPLSYLAGERLGALTLLAPTPALVALSVGWALLTPALLRLGRHFNGYGINTNLERSRA
jgi:hypothetical protein